MHTAQLFLSRMTVLGTFSIAALVLLAGRPAIAQETGAGSLLNNPQSGDSVQSDPFSNNGSGQLNSVFSIINRAILAPTTSDGEFLRQQQESLGQEAADFRTRQQELLRQQSQQPAAEPSSQAN